MRVFGARRERVARIYVDKLNATRTNLEAKERICRELRREALR